MQCCVAIVYLINTLNEKGLPLFLVIIKVLLKVSF